MVRLLKHGTVKAFVQKLIESPLGGEGGGGGGEGTQKHQKKKIKYNF